MKIGEVLKKRKKKRTWQKKKISIITLVSILSVALFGVVVILFLVSNNSNVRMYDATKYNVLVNEELFAAYNNDGERYYPYEAVKKGIDRYIWYDEKERIITLINDKHLMDIKVDDSENENILQVAGEIFLKESFVSEFYDKDFEYIEENNLTIIFNDEIYIGEAVSLMDELCVRTGPSRREPRVKVIENKNGEDVAKCIEYTNDTWVKVVTLTGEVGFVERAEIEIKKNDDVSTYIHGFNRKLPGEENGKEKIEEFKRIFQNKKINMVWEAVYSRNPNLESIGDMDGLNVIAPTWFELEDETGRIKSMADSSYVKWAHDRGYYVWGTAVSVTDYDLTSKVLSNMKIRRAYIEKLVEYLTEYGLDGLNIDFEYMYEEDKELFTQFVRELSFYSHFVGKIVSCDVTILSNSPKWSLCYDRKALSNAVDYMCVMFYDQHTGGGGKAGSVGQLKWVIDSAERLMEHIPNDKLILGMPFYTRLWEEKKSENGEISLSSTIMSMNASKQWCKDNNVIPKWDEESGQYYAELNEGSSVFKLWIEDAVSIEKRVELVKEYNLAGCAAWRRGFESEDVWKIIKKELEIALNK